MTDGTIWVIGKRTWGALYFPSVAIGIVWTVGVVALASSLPGAALCVSCLVNKVHVRRRMVCLVCLEPLSPIIAIACDPRVSRPLHARMLSMGMVFSLGVSENPLPASLTTVHY